MTANDLQLRGHSFDAGRLGEPAPIRPDGRCAGLVGAFADSGLLAAGAEGLEGARLRTREGESLPFAAARWHLPASTEEVAVLDHVVGPVIDLACGPGRLVRHLIDRGVVAVGVDAAPDAVASAHKKGVPALLASLWDALPQEGAWETVLLFDGNIGIGAEPAALLARGAELLAPQGGLVVEVGSSGTRTRAVEARIEWGRLRSVWFPWATVAVTDLPGLADEAGLGVCWVQERAGRCFARLEAAWSPGADVAA